MRVGILGGTFDPLHNGHLAVAGEAEKQMGLNEVIFVPAGRPWLKEDRVITPAEHRLEMVRLAIADNPYFKLSIIEVERPGSSYTVDTLAEMRRQLGKKDELYFIIGMGDLAQLPRWKNPDRLVSLCLLVVAPRPGYALPEMESLEKEIPGLSGRVRFLSAPHLDISASEIRERVAVGLPVNHLVPEAVDHYIKQNGLYWSV